MGTEWGLYLSLENTVAYNRLRVCATVGAKHPCRDERAQAGEAVDATASPSLAEEHGVGGFPTLLLFKDGEYREKYNG